jgi:hypothetical protein
MRRIGAAWFDGFRRVLAVPAVVVGVLGATVLTALPLAVAMRDLLADGFGRSEEAALMATSFHLDWWQEFAAGASGIGTTFGPSLIGFATTLDTWGRLLDAAPLLAPLAAAVAVYLGAWTFLTGGILDRYARQRPTRSVGFFSACGVFFFRFLRLAVVAGAAYWFLFTTVHPYLFDTLLDPRTVELAVERDAFAWRLLMYVVFALLLAVVALVVDYAKVRAVVEDRRSMIGALFASLGFIVRHPGRVLGLYLLNTLTFLALLGLWALVAPGVGGLGASMWWGFALGQCYVLARLVLKLQELASQTSLFQASLAHAAYTAVPVAEWPESPAAELIPSAEWSAPSPARGAPP